MALTATLKKTTIERWSASKKCYIWVKAYIITNPEGIELAPPLPAVASHYEQSARQFCLQNGWQIKII